VGGPTGYSRTGDLHFLLTEAGDNNLQGRLYEGISHPYQQGHFYKHLQAWLLSLAMKHIFLLEVFGKFKIARVCQLFLFICPQTVACLQEENEKLKSRLKTIETQVNFL